jgi:hypothetical protein
VGLYYSINVAINLGIPFIWIDRYCIPEEQATKHAQLSMMYVIYVGAEITIIAVDGIDANTELSGISRERHKKPELTLMP